MDSQCSTPAFPLHLASDEIGSDAFGYPICETKEAGTMRLDRVIYAKHHGPEFLDRDHWMISHRDGCRQNLNLKNLQAVPIRRAA